MLISDQHRLIIMLPEKCGTGTVQKRLNHIHSCSDIGSSPYYNKEAKRYLSKHLTLSTASRLSAYKQRKNYRKACFVRNPYDRIYSWFGYQKDLCERNAVSLGKQPYEIARNLDGDEVSQARTKQRRNRLKEKMAVASFEFNQYI